uniref:C2H2-type domain-containing protein n=1 Tax=Meloidogyne floridensis TaxID=298350 RepID=A0A915NNF1_9BILA
MFEMQQTSLTDQHLIIPTTNNTNKTTKTNRTTTNNNNTNFVLESWNTSQHVGEQNIISSNRVSSDLVSTTTLMPSFPSSFVGGVVGGVGSSPLDDLIKFHERLNHDGDFPSSTASSSFTPKLPASSSSLSQLKDSHLLQQPTSSEENLETSTLFDPLIATQQLGNLSSYSSPFVLDPSSPSALMLSSYAQLAPTMAAASTSWSGEMAALLCRGEGEGINSAAGFRGSWGGDGSGYLGNALGALVHPSQASFSPNFFSSTTSDRSSLSSQSSYPSFSASFADLKTLATTRELQQNNQETNILPPQERSFSTSSTSTIISQFDQHKLRSNKNNNIGKQSSQQLKNKAGGKIRTSVNAKNNCECPNCKELERLGAQIDQKYEKHNCHVPGCHKVYSRSSHLKAHLRWHSNDRPPTTKRRLFDPPEGPPPKPVPLNLDLKALAATVQSGQNLEQMRGREN